MAKDSTNHFVQLDGLRGLAIFGVFLSHFIVPEVGDWHYFAFGSLGVRLFFVLSGFLITGILLRSKDLIDHGQGVTYTLKAFYFRRTLRIFCVYYAWLAFIAIFVYRDSRLLWDFLYLSNFYDMIYLQGHGNQYWSLAVEEQFYLVWPFFILFCPRRYLKASLVGLIIGVFTMRLYLGLSGAEYLLVKKFPILCVDALGIGGLVALLFQNKQAFEIIIRKRVLNLSILAGLSLTLCAMWEVWSQQVKGCFYTGLLHTGFALISGGLLIGAVRGFQGAAGRILSFQPLCYLGKISYGCYLFHLAVQSWFGGLGLFQSEGSFALGLVAFFLKFLITIIVATLSWYAFENPINSLKDWFPMDQRKVLERRALIRCLLKSYGHRVMHFKTRIFRVQE